MKENKNPHWSYSSFNCYMQCPMKYYFRYIEKAPVERTGSCLPLGRAFHGVLSQRALQGAAFTLAEGIGEFAQLFKAETEAAENLTFKEGEDYDACLRKGSDMLKVAFDNWQDDFAVKHVAESFTVSVPELHKPLIGEFDLVVTDGGDEAIVDWKSASAKWPSGKADMEFQATLYCYAYKELHKLNPIFRYDVYTKTKQPAVNSYYTLRTEDELQRFEWVVRNIEHNVEEGLFYPVENLMNCSECPYRERCKKCHSPSTKCLNHSGMSSE